jgi:anti-sigma-K factor RskA
MTTANPFTDELIQSFVAGTLDAENAAALQLAAQTDAALAAEIALRRTVREIGAEEAGQRQPDALLWTRIGRSIADLAPQERRAANDRDVVAAQPFWARPLIAPWQAVASLALALVGWQALIAPTLTPANPDDSAEYALAGEDRSASFVLRVAFVEAASEAELRALLQAVGARIIDGPSAVGLYDLAFDDAEALARARTRLAQEGELVNQIAAN